MREEGTNIGAFSTGKIAGLAGERLRSGVAQRRVVVEDVEAAAEGGEDQVVLALLDGEVAHRDGRASRP